MRTPTRVNLAGVSAGLLIDSATPRAWLAWACGVQLASHALYLHHIPIPTVTIAPAYYGTTLPQGLFLEATSSATILRQGQKTLWRITYPEITALITLERIGIGLHADIRAAMTERRKRTPSYHPARTMAWYRRAQAEQERAAWREIETRCYQLGALAWDRCRPRATQLELFSLSRDEGEQQANT